MLKTLVSATALVSVALLQGCDGTSVSYTQDVQPILSKHCSECHLPGGQGEEASGFLVDSYTSVLKGTKHGPVVVAGDPLSSSLYRLISGRVDKSIQMPHSKEPLPVSEIELIEKWINEGAKDN
ncbi:c-type cytochrome domain-containing protein [Thiospirillum jenense]|uniref:Cytochrome C Planctomycete-type domain-containing protein n=1 Tax=Thiospirillum jenense TaxID=1653858 RepID=A0A839HEB8_9GAMM|nr:c-type cytochrome domain-containing protein [Thiospirillum jenense]MBB1127223.1 hypothetical protein [Thiospirillum jenense]